MPRSRINCHSCHKEITDIRQGTAKKLEWIDPVKRELRRIFLHQDCYERDNAQKEDMTPEPTGKTADSFKRV